MHLYFLQYTVNVTFSVMHTFLIFICDVQKCEHVLLIWIQMNLIYFLKSRFLPVHCEHLPWHSPHSQVCLCERILSDRATEPIGCPSMCVFRKCASLPSEEAGTDGRRGSWCAYCSSVVKGPKIRTPIPQSPYQVVSLFTAKFRPH